MDDLSKNDWHDPEKAMHFAKNYDQRYGDVFWQTFDELIGSVSDVVIADFGCGPGLWLRDAGIRLHARKLIGIDASPAMLEYAEGALNSSEAPSFQLHLADFDIEGIPLSDSTVDLGFSGYFLHELKNPRAFIIQLFERLNADGLCVVLDFVSGHPDEFARQLQQAGMNEDEARRRYPHMCKHSVEDIERILGSAGFEEVRSKKIQQTRALIVGEKKLKHE